MISVKHLLFLSLMTFGSFGCGSDRDAYPVEFQVLVQGKPATGATVVLHPVGAVSQDQIKPMGKVDESGTVRLSTFAQQDGAPAGEYTVTVVWYDLKSSSEQAFIISGGDKLKGAHSKPDSPSALRITVKKEQNKLPPLQL